MKPGYTTTLLTTLSVLVIIAVVVYLARYTDEKPIYEGAAIPVAESEEAVGIEAVEEEHEEITGEAPREPMEPARRVAHAPPESQPSDDGQQVANPFNTSPAALVTESVKNLDKALDGNLEAAQFLLNARTMCQAVPRGEASIQAMLLAREGIYEKMSTFMESQQPDGSLGTGTTKVFPTAEQQRNHYEKWGKACDQFEESISALFSGELAGLAEDGHVIARYLYAVWEPAFSSSIDWFKAKQDWQLNALRYSYDNLQNGEPLGMLAFAESYERTLFTGMDRALALALKMAAVDCGLEMPDLIGVVEFANQSADNPRYWVFMKGATPEDVRSMARGFYEEYCQ